MTKRTTKRAFLLSILSMMLCVAMLVGSTFAWFTDSVTSGMNTIVAGNLDVELYHTNALIKDTATDEEKKVDGKTTLFVSADENFQWEPGAMLYENFTVKNAGSLALTYILTLKTESPEEGITLENVLRVAVLDGAFNGDRAEALKLNFDMTVAQFVARGAVAASGMLNAEATDTCAIIIYWMPTDNDNAYNLNNGSEELYITLGVNLFATQAVAESDSFGNDYDMSPEQNVNAAVLIAKGYKAVNSIEELNNVTDTKIFLNKDITTKNWELTFAELTEIELNGHSFNGKVVVNNGANVTITDSLGGGSIDSVEVKSGTLTLDNCTLTKFMNVAGGAELIIKGGKCNTTLNTAAMQNTAPKLTIEDGEFSGGEYDMFFLGTNSVLNINGGKFSGKSSFWSTVGEGANITINDGSFENLGAIGMGPNVKFTIEDGTFTNLGTFSLRRGNELTINGGTFTGLKISPLYSEVSQVTVTINGGTFDSEIPASYLGKDKVCVDNGDGTWTVKDGYTLNGVTVDLTEEAYKSIVYHDKPGYTDKIFSIELWSKADLVSAVKLINEGVICHNRTNDIHPKLIFMADIDFGGDNFTGLISNIDVEGNGHTLSNIKFVAGSGGKAGFIPYAGNNKVSNLTIKDATVIGSQAGIFGGNAANAHLTDCKLVGNITVIYEKSAEDYNGVGAVFGVISEGNSTIGVDVTEATITIILEGISYAANKEAETATNLVGVVYGGSYTIK